MQKSSPKDISKLARILESDRTMLLLMGDSWGLRLNAAEWTGMSSLPDNLEAV